MGLEILISNINRLIEHWGKQNITIRSRSSEGIAMFEASKQINLPIDFKEYFIRVNGMGSYYPNNIDDEGFLFYPLEELVTLQEEFGTDDVINTDSPIIIFAEYMHKSWWYGVQLNDMNGTYEIGIIPYKERFKSITSSLAVFIDLYLQDDPILYDYK